MGLAAEERFVKALGSGVARTWSGLPQETQQVIFAAAISASGEGNKFREELAMFLHKHHPRTR